ncbi:hypothetical protein [Rhodanobacter ginsengiterrae]|uniref:hypothetical protein n=1 Tax=Rhodanobacter ginsengiterrae TaxID=2008451 RepID=UPI003CEDBA01
MLQPARCSRSATSRHHMQGKTMWFASFILNALVTGLLLAGLPFPGHVVWHKWRHKRRFVEIARRAGPQGRAARYVLISAGAIVPSPY